MSDDEDQYRDPYRRPEWNGNRPDSQWMTRSKLPELPRNEPPRLPWPPEVVRDAMVSVFARRLGVAPSENDHPLTDDIIERAPSIRDVIANADPEAWMLARIADRTGSPEHQRRFQNRLASLHNSDDFAAALGEGLQRLVFQAYTAAADHRRIARMVPVPNFKPVEFPVATLGLDESDVPVLEHGELPEIRVAVAGGLTGAVSSWTRTLGIARRVFINDQVGVIASSFGAIGPFAARREARRVFGVLTANPTLADGRALFNATDENLLAAAPLDKTNLGEAFARLRRQKTIAGGETGHRPRFLIVAPEDEVAALELVASLTAGRREAPVEVLAAVEVPSGTWFVLADPAVAPVVGFLHLAGSTQTLRVEPARVSPRFDGSGFRVTHDFGTVALGRVGAVKGVAA